MAFIRNAQNFTAAQADVASTISSAFRYDDEYSRSYNSSYKITTAHTSTHTTSNYRTKPCLKGENCTYIDEKTGEDKCQFANDPSKLVPVKCMYNARCRNEHCKRLHDGQTMEEYITINQFTWPEKIEKVKTPEISENEMSEITTKYNSTSFTIRIDDTDDESEDNSDEEHEDNIDDEDSAIDRACEAGNAEHYKIVNGPSSPFSSPPAPAKIVEKLSQESDPSEDMTIETEQSMMEEEAAIKATRDRSEKQLPDFNTEPFYKTCQSWTTSPHDLIASRILSIQEQTLREIDDEIEEVCDEIAIEKNEFVEQHKQEFLQESENCDYDPEYRDYGDAEFEEFVERMDALTTYKNAQARALYELEYVQFAYQHARAVMGLNAF